MASVDKSSEPTNLDDKSVADAAQPSCLNDPNYAIICVFLQKFGGQLKIEHPNFLRLQKMIENTDEVHDELKQFFVKLLRKTRKSVQPDKLDSALAKFCYTYSAQDAWEVERFGFKKSSLSVKVRILKEILESQFDKNPNFRTSISAQSANELRSQPLGKDRLGNAYWSTIDDQCNLRIYQEHLDEEIWKVVASNREEMVKLIACLRSNELVMPSLLGIIDEDSSSNSMPAKVDALQNENVAVNDVANSTDGDDKNVPCIKIKLNPGGGESTVEQISNDDNTNGAKNPSQNDSVEDDEEEEDASNMSEIDEHSQAASESSATTVGTKSNETQGSKRITLIASKPPSNANKLKLRIFNSDKRSLKRNLEEDSDTATSQNKRSLMASKKSNTDDDSEFGSEEMSDEEIDENDISGDDEVGPAIEEPTMYVQGDGSGAANKCENILWPDCDELDEDGIGEAIEEEMFFVFGEGSGCECDVGNNDIKSSETPASSTAAQQPIVPSKPMFFFGQAGCLKLSPMKTVATSESTSDSSSENPATPPSNQESLSNPADEDITNDTNSVALDAKSNANPANTANNDETDKGVSIVNEVSASSAPQNNVLADKMEQSTVISNDLPSAVTENEKSPENIPTQVVEHSSDICSSESSKECLSNTTTEIESSKEANIDSNSLVALASISVQEKEETEKPSESIESESQPSLSEVLQTESHLPCDESKDSEISDSCQVENQSSELVTSVDAKELNESKGKSEPENKIIENSEIVNESIVLGDENQSNVRQTENERVADIEKPTTDDTTTSCENIETNEQIEPSIDQAQESDDSKDPANNGDELPATVESEPKIEIETSNELTNESNSDVKTESLSEQNESTIEHILPVETQPECEVSQDIPTDNSTALPSQSDDTNQQTNDRPSAEHIVEPKELIEEKPTSPVAVNETDEITETVENANELPLETERTASIPEIDENVENISNEQEPIIASTNVPAAETFNEPISATVDQQESIDAKEQAEPTENTQSSTTSETLEKTQIDEIEKPDIIPISVTEKRKSSDETEDSSECKKICEEKNPVEAQEPSNIEVNAVEVNTVVEQKIDEIQSNSHNEIVLKPKDDAVEQIISAETIQSSKICRNDDSVSDALESNISAKEVDEKDEEISAIESGSTSKDTIDIPNKIESSVGISENIVEPPISKEELSSPAKKPELNATVSTIEAPNLSETSDEPIKINEQNAAIPSPITNEQPATPILQNEQSAAVNEQTAVESVESAVKSSNKEKPIETTSSRGCQLRARKRRISSEKLRHSSESDDNTDAFAIESPLPLSRDVSSDEEVGGKRIKMRPKVVKRSMRRSVEQKRNIKDTEWSSDDNEKPNAKRATSDLLKSTENILPLCDKIVAKDESKSPIKAEIMPIAKQEAHDDETTSAVNTTKIKDEEEDKLSDDERVATPTRRPGRPARRGRKPGPKPKPKVTEDIKSEKIKDEPVKPVIKEELNQEIKPEPKPETTSAKPETRRKKRSLLGLDMADVETIQAAADNEPPVRQSRRIAQIKIKEEAERRKAEEVALTKLKLASEKKKKGVTVQESASEEEENSESEAKLEKKKPRKKGNKDKPWQTDSDADSSERDDDEHEYDHEDVERLPPLRSDHEFSPESDIEDESQIVPMKRARTARKDKTERREEESEEEEDIHACQKCTKNDHPEWILLCDKCDKGYHCSCLNPVLFVIPEGDWFCPLCQQEKLIGELEAKLIEFDNIVKEKEIEEAQRQRLLLTTISEANVLRESKRDRQRAQARERDDGSDESSDYSSSEGSDAEKKQTNQDRRTRPRPKPTRQRDRSESSEQSSSDDTSDNEPIYKLRKRRQANVSYRFNEYDELINRAIKSEMDEVAGAGNLGRGKDISTIIEADKEEKRLKKLELEQKDRDVPGESNEKDDDSDDQPLKTKVDNSDDSDSEPIKPKVIKRSKSASGKKKKKLNSLDIDSEEDVDSSDDDFNTSSYSDEEEEDDSSAASESSLESLVKKRRKGRAVTTRRSVRERKKRFDADFIDDSSFDDEDNKPLVKKKKKTESDFSDFNDSSEELDEDVDSDDLCDDSTDDSDRSWGKRKSKSKPTSKTISKKVPREKTDGEFKGKTAKKKPKVSDDESDDDDGDEVLPKSRRTRGKKLPYLLDDDFDSSDDGIKPGVKRPDTPPEERAAFIKRQEEIKRMLAEKKDESDKIPPPATDSLSTIPPQIIQTAKALDVDLKKSAILHKNASDNDSNGFDDDLPEDFDPEDMDEDAIAKMMEEEEFAQQQLKLAGETIRNRKLKDALTEPLKKDDVPSKLIIETGPSVIMPPNIPPSLVSPLPISTAQLTIPDIPPSMYSAQFQTSNNKTVTTPKKRGRKTKDDITPIAIKEPTHPLIPSMSSISVIPTIPPIPSIATIQHTSIVPQNKPNPLLSMQSVLQHAPTSQIFASPTIQHTSSVIAHSSVIRQQPPPPRAIPSIISHPTTPGILGIAQNREQIIPSTVLDVQNTRLLDPSELGKPPDDLLDPAAKKRGRRKKITPTRDSLTSPPNVTITAGVTQPSAIKIPNVPNVTKTTTSILSERLSANLSTNPVEKPGLSVATPPQLYSPSSRSQASVITRLTQRQPFPSGQSQPQRFYAPNASMPPHAIPTTGSLSRPYHSPNVTVAAGPRPSQSPLVPPSHTSGHLPHPMYMRGQPGIYAGYPNIQPSPMHRSLQSIEHASNSPQNFTGPYQNIPFGSYYAAAAAAERRSGAIIGTFEPFDNKNPSSHDRLPAYAHPGLGLAALAGRNPSGEGDDDRSAPHGAGSSEFSGLVSYFSSQQDDLDS